LLKDIYRIFANIYAIVIVLVYYRIEAAIIGKKKGIKRVFVKSGPKYLKCSFMLITLEKAPHIIEICG